MVLIFLGGLGGGVLSIIRDSAPLAMISGAMMVMAVFGFWRLSEIEDL